MLAKNWSISELCCLFDVARSGYYKWNLREIGKRSKENRQLSDKIRQIHRKSKDIYGVPRIIPELKKLGYKCGHNRVARLMKQMGIRGIMKRGFHPQTTESRHPLPVSPNLLKKHPALTGPNQIWVADITYIRTEEGWLYLAAIMDLWSRTIVGWQTSNSLKSELVTDALQQAIDNRQPEQGLIHHSDRGKQYASTVCRNILESAKIKSSMTFSGNCYDNAAIESFWSSIKTEMIYRQRFETHRDAHLAIFAYIEIFYNRKRLHSSLGYKSPVEFEIQHKKPVFTVSQLSTFSG